MSRSKGWGKAQREQLEHLGEGWGEDGGCHLLALPAPMDRSRKRVGTQVSSNYNPPQKQSVLCRESRRQRLGGSAQVTHRQASSSDCEGRRGLAAETLRLQRSKGLFAILSSRIPLPGLHREAAGIFALRYLGTPLGLVVGAWRGTAVGCLERCQGGCNPPTLSSLAFPDPPRLAGLQRSTVFVSASPRVLRAQDLSQASFWQTCLSGCYIASGQGLVSVVLVPVYTALAAFGTGEECHFIPGLPRELITV